MIGLISPNKRLLDFKCRPEWVLPSLRIVDENVGNWKKIWSELVLMSKRQGSHAEHDDNIVSAIINPTLRNLRLAVGDGEKIRLTQDGKQCLNAFESGQLLSFKKRFSYQIIQVDRSNTDLLGFLMENHNSKETAIGIQALREELVTLGITNAAKVTPIQGWINFFGYVDLIRKVKSGIYLVAAQYLSIKDGEKYPNLSVVREVFVEASNRLRKSTQGSPYIPIPDFREYVCSRLGISSFSFEKLVKQLITDKNTRLVLSTPTRRVTGGLILEGKYYYFISVYPR